MKPGEVTPGVCARPYFGHTLGVTFLKSPTLLISFLSFLFRITHARQTLGRRRVEQRANDHATSAPANVARSWNGLLGTRASYVPSPACACGAGSNKGGGSTKYESHSNCLHTRLCFMPVGTDAAPRDSVHQSSPSSSREIDRRTVRMCLLHAIGCASRVTYCKFSSRAHASDCLCA